jgi:hypothetical protein
LGVCVQPQQVPANMSIMPVWPYGANPNFYVYPPSFFPPNYQQGPGGATPTAGPYPYSASAHTSGKI